jgi:hypothetical protein
VNSSALATPFGFLIGSRTAANAHVIYRNGASLASNAGSGGGIPALAAFVFAINTAATPTGFTASPLGSYSIGSGLTSADVTAYNSHIQAFQATLGRNV